MHQMFLKDVFIINNVKNLLWGFMVGSTNGLILKISPNIFRPVTEKSTDENEFSFLFLAKYQLAPQLFQEEGEFQSFSHGLRKDGI